MLWAAAPAPGATLGSSSSELPTRRVEGEWTCGATDKFASDMQKGPAALEAYALLGCDWG